MTTHSPQEKPKVLLIEDDPLFQELAGAVLSPHCMLFIASTIEEGEHILSTHEDMSVLILDGRVPLSRRDVRMGTTLLLAENIMHVRGDSITLFAASGDALLNAAFVNIGARSTDKFTAYAAAARFLCGRE